jgi:glycine cleavage system H protein
MTPQDLKYAKTHEWLRMEGDTAVVGITDHAQGALGDITFVELPEVGSEVGQGAECGVIESVKAASDLYAPVAGQVSEVNTTLADTPELVNQDPYGAGWIFKLAQADPASADTLMDADAYEAMIATET